ncbi:murein biosynthesis integral membrane protein MurJ [Nocardioides sp.]|uniref:murein biosynthesis integral membrane protein MurJ n=1 Tax=Nocardioides sp. TaxID=35761 RepID=UPI002C73A34C|nr:murein biosynthesis integral membrane protein MurJ [Nocardioides sp.]HSX66267.1 murein biosynthesis integral membrane protein MurJ [Nocardioides sp.]
MTESRSVIGNSAIMAAGTVVSRLSGYVRSILLAAALGIALHADIFNIANSVPNILYVLLVGGVVNAVLVPQLVRSARDDADGGEAFTNRIVTLAALFLLVVTVALVVAAPWVMSLYLDSRFNEAELAAQRQSVIDFARFCLPQVFFYGMFVLVGQILNSRGSFAPMFWAPIANNLISIATLLAYLFLFGPASKDEVTDAYGAGQELLLGLGSTLGIVAQFLILLPYLRAVGFRYKPRFDFRGTGLGHTLRLGMWTVLLIVVSQIANLVVVRLASSGTAGGALDASGDAGTGYTVYSNASLLTLVPHSIVTVSLATAILPRLAAYAHASDEASMIRTLSSSLRTALALVLPFVALLPVVARDLSALVWGYGAASETAGDIAPTLALMGISLIFFTTHYLVVRGFYALERTRQVFWIQCAIAAANIVLAFALVTRASAQETTAALAIAYTGAYAVGAVLAYLLLARRLGGLDSGRLVRFLVRTVLALVPAVGAAYPANRVLSGVVGDDPAKVEIVILLAVVGGVYGLVFLAAARIFRIVEVTDLVQGVTRRIPGLR